MRKTNIFFISLLLCILFVPCRTLALSIGMAPPVYDLGKVNPGKQYYMDFYIISDQEKDVLVNLESVPAPDDFYLPERSRFRYDFNTTASSEEDVSSWIRFLDNPVIVPPEKKLYRLSNGGIANANKRVTAVISIPKDAEPGYHAGHVLPQPRQQAQGGGTGLGIVTLAKMGYVFNVEGTPIRKGKIIGFMSDNIGQLYLVFKNTGTVTMTVWADNVKIFNENRTLLSRFSSRKEKISPRKTVFIPLGKIQAIKKGKYPAEASVRWIGGNTSFKGIADISFIEGPLLTGKAATKQSSATPGFPIWAISLVIIILSLAFYGWKK